MGEFEGSARLSSSVGSALAAPRRKKRNVGVENLMVTLRIERCGRYKGL
jgi:hypothetical protein